MYCCLQSSKPVLLFNVAACDFRHATICLSGPRWTESYRYQQLSNTTGFNAKEHSYQMPLHLECQQRLRCILWNSCLACLTFLLSFFWQNLHVIHRCGSATLCTTRSSPCLAGLGPTSSPSNTPGTTSWCTPCPVSADSSTDSGSGSGGACCETRWVHASCWAVLQVIVVQIRPRSAVQHRCQCIKLIFLKWVDPGDCLLVIVMKLPMYDWILQHQGWL